jgi:prevent-host-death family protein
VGYNRKKESEGIEVPNIKPISDLRNYTAVINEVSYGQRVYLTRNGHGHCAIIDMKELDELDKQKALMQLMEKLKEAEKSICEEGTVSADELERELGV